MQPRKREAAETQSERWQVDVVRGLADVFSGFEIVDRDLDLGENRRVQLVGVESTGRIVLVLMVSSDGADPLLATLDALAFVQRNRAMLAAHFEVAHVRVDVAPVVALVAETFSEKLLGRLSGLNAEHVRLFEMRTLSSARGDRSYLAPVIATPARAAAAAPRSSETFLRALPAHHRELAELVLRRVARIDDQLVLAASERAVTWRLAGEVICSLASTDERLEAQVSPDGRPRRLASSSDVETFVDQALARYVDLLAHPAAETSNSTIPLQPVEPRALLTAEEIAAFRQPG